jgi:uncharacterized OB-fold protein
MYPASYWRQTKNWSAWIGRKGTVIVSTSVAVSSPEQAEFKPYSFVLVDFESEKHEFMGTSHDVFQPGDVVECVLRKIASGDERGLVGYGIKIQKVAT